MAPTLPTVRRIDFGYFVRPADETGTGQPRVEPLLGYAIGHRDGVVLFDTGLGEGDADADARYRPTRRSLLQALRSVEIAVDDVRWVANCHLHFDHCGGNPALAGRPIFVQRIELRMARTTKDYTLPHLIDFAQAAYRQIDGETEILPDVFLIPTPGHTPGHQAIAVRHRDGTVILAGQAHNTAFDYTADQLAWRARQEGRVDDPAITYQPWIERLQQLDPSRVVFAHDYAVWEPASGLFTKA
jgi:glyoxylase-like metal-dependent hydrolase (beta-lactamase superfamily II)